MANYYATSRTSYAKVRDEALFMAWAESIPDAKVITKVHAKHGTLYGLLFGDDPGAIPTLRPDVNWRAERLPDDTGEETEFLANFYDRDWVEFDIYAEVQEHLCSGWAMTFLEVGAEKHRYLCGFAAVVTADSFQCTSLDRWVTTAVEALGSPECTAAEY